MDSDEGCRIAFVTAGWNAYARRLASGINGFTKPSRGSVAREFMLSPADTKTSAALSAWSPDAVVSFLSDEVLVDLERMLPDGLPHVACAGARPREGLAVVVGDAHEAYDTVHRHFREIGVDHVWQFSFGENRGEFSTQHRYRQYTAAAGLPFRSYWAPDIEQLSDIPRLEQFDAEFTRWLREMPKPAGIFSQHTYAGAYLCRACEVLGINVPGEVSLIGADGFDVATTGPVGVSSFTPPGQAVGYRAAQVAASMANGADAPAEAVIVRGLSLIARQSTRLETQRGCDIDAALAFIEDHACMGIKVHDVMTCTQSVSRATFHKRFLGATGATPAATIQERRMREARSLLTHSEMSTGAIAGLCGYEDYLHFYRVFRKMAGVSPTQYRRLAV